MEETEFKKTNTKLGEGLCMALPLIEELIEKDMMPICIIGVSGELPDNLQVWFATHHYTIDSVVVEMCRQLVYNYDSKNKQTKPATAGSGE